MKPVAALLVMLHLMGCASVGVRSDTVDVGLPRDSWVEQQPLPPLPTEDVTVKDNRVAPLSESEKAPFAGILLSEDKTKLALSYKNRYTQLRINYEQDRKVWSSHREFYEFQLNAAQKKMDSLRPGWFEQHKLELGIIGGFVLGIVTTTAIAFAVHL